jgi:hypothetical protein
VIGSAYKAPESFFTSYHRHVGIPCSRRAFPPRFGPDSQQTQATFGQSPSSKLAFAIDPQIDIHSRALLDMISDKLEGDQQLPARAKTVAEGHDISIDEAFNDW